MFYLYGQRVNVMPQPVARSQPIVASLRPGTRVKVPEQLSQMLEGEGVYGQTRAPQQRPSCRWDGGEEAPRAVMAGGRAGCVAEGAACVWTSTVPPAKHTAANSVQRKAARLLPVLGVKQVPSLLCLHFCRFGLCLGTPEAGREPLGTSSCCFRCCW